MYNFGDKYLPRRKGRKEGWMEGRKGSHARPTCVLPLVHVVHMGGMFFGDERGKSDLRRNVGLT